MSNEQILLQTASEQLSLEEEFEMQVTWATDADKRTCILIPRHKLHESLRKLEVIDGKNPIEYLKGDDFIRKDYILDRCKTQVSGVCKFCGQNSESVVNLSQNNDNNDESFNCCIQCESNAACGDFGVDVAVGDVNLFLHDYLQDDDDDDDDFAENDDSNNQCVGVDCDSSENKQPTVVEVEIMIAEQTARRSGYGQHAVKLMTQYAVEWLGILRFIAKINNDNTPSLEMFQKKLNYVEYARVECFDEIHLDWKADKALEFPWFPSRSRK
jgi:RimJ/RimL family protein N-acetyltransferase